MVRLRHDNGETLGVKAAGALVELAEDFKELEALIEGLSKTTRKDGEPTTTASSLKARLLRFDAKQAGLFSDEN